MAITRGMRRTAGALLVVGMVGAGHPTLAEMTWPPRTSDDYGRASWALHVLFCGHNDTDARFGPLPPDQCETSWNTSVQWLSVLMTLERRQRETGQPINLPPFPDFGAVVQREVIAAAGSMTPGWTVSVDDALFPAPIPLIEQAGQALTLSYGMVQRLAISQAIVAEPELIILDEPTVAPDSAPSSMAVDAEEAATAADAVAEPPRQ